jgi:hypothetical protein
MEGPIVRHVERRARRLNDMIRLLEVDEIALIRLSHGEAYVQARTNCLRCASVGECLLWLESKDRKDAAPVFCPNRSLFSKCRRHLT